MSLPLPQTLMPIAQQQRHQIFDQPPGPRLDLGGDGHPRREVDELVLDLHLPTLERDPGRIKQFLPFRFTRIGQRA